LVGAKEFGSKLPFLAAGKEGTRYGLRLVGVNQWEAKKSDKAKTGDWRCQFKCEVIHSEGDGATPVKTVVGILIMEDKKFDTYHFQDFRKVFSAIIGSHGEEFVEDSPATQEKIDNLFKGKYNGTIFAAQLSPNPDEKKAKFPLATYFPVTDDAEPA